MSQRPMQPSQVNTIQVPTIGTNNPATLVIAALVPTRIVVRNVGAVIVFLAHSSAEIQSINTTAGVYRLPAGQEDVFVLAPQQGLWAVASGAVGTVSIAISEAMSIFWGES